MSVKDFIKKSVLENFSPYNVPQMAAALLAAVLLGALIYWVYQRFYAGVLFSRSFAMTLVGMSVLTCMVTLAISSNVVISLGMVGALSIVRFRTAVKDPLDLLYLFWAITAGITTGAGMYLLAASASAPCSPAGRRQAASMWRCCTIRAKSRGMKSSVPWGGTGTRSNRRRFGARRSRWRWRSAAGTMSGMLPIGCRKSRAWRT